MTGPSRRGGTVTHASAVPVEATFVHQVHGARVLVVDQSSGPLADEADAVVMRGRPTIGAPVDALAMLGADCGLIGMSSPEGVIAAVHAGWKGLVAGVVEAAVDAMTDLGATAIEAALGPIIGVECYAFSDSDLDLVAARYGSDVRGLTDDGGPALDLRATVAIALATSGVRLVAQLGGCTSCDGRFYSWRGRRDTGRHALVISRPLLDAETGRR